MRVSLELMDVNSMLGFIFDFDVEKIQIKAWYDRVQGKKWAQLFANVKWPDPTRQSKPKNYDLNAILSDPNLTSKYGWDEMFEKGAQERRKPSYIDPWED